MYPCCGVEYAVEQAAASNHHARCRANKEESFFCLNPSLFGRARYELSAFGILI